MTVGIVGNAFKVALGNKEVDLDTDVFKLALMKPSFVYNRSTHNSWSAVSGEEIAAGNGYSAGGVQLISGELVQNNVSNKGIMTWANNLIRANGGFIADTDCAIIYDDSHPTKMVMGHGDFGTTYSIADGLVLRLTSIVVNLG